jgi:predicted esterase
LLTLLKHPYSLFFFKISDKIHFFTSWLKKMPIPISPNLSNASFNFIPAVRQSSRKIWQLVKILVIETFATLRYVLPAALVWLIREKYTKAFSIYSFSLSIEGIQTKARLYQHGPLAVEENKHYQPILFIHGDYGHPFTLVHLADIANSHSKTPVFSLYIPSIHQDKLFLQQAALIDRIIDKMESLIVERKGIFNGVFAVGHSKGAMLLAQKQFDSEASKKIAKTFSIAGPLNADDQYHCFQEPLKSIFAKVHQKILLHKERKIIQVIPENDWIAPYEVMAVRPEEHCYTVPGMHLSGLYSKKTAELFKSFLAQT